MFSKSYFSFQTEEALSKTKRRQFFVFLTVLLSYLTCDISDKVIIRGKE